MAKVWLAGQRARRIRDEKYIEKLESYIDTLELELSKRRPSAPLVLDPEQFSDLRKLGWSFVNLLREYMRPSDVGEGLDGFLGGETLVVKDVPSYDAVQRRVGRYKRR